MSVPGVEVVCGLTHWTSSFYLGFWIKLMYFLPHKSLHIGNSQTAEESPREQFLLLSPGDPQLVGLLVSISGMPASQTAHTPRGLGTASLKPVF